MTGTSGEAWLYYKRCVGTHQIISHHKYVYVAPDVPCGLDVSAVVHRPLGARIDIITLMPCWMTTNPKGFHVQLGIPTLRSCYLSSSSAVGYMTRPILLLVVIVTYPVERPIGCTTVVLVLYTSEYYARIRRQQPNGSWSSGQQLTTSRTVGTLQSESAAVELSPPSEHE